MTSHTEREASSKIELFTVHCFRNFAHRCQTKATDLLNNVHEQTKKKKINRDKRSLRLEELRETEERIVLLKFKKWKENVSRQSSQLKLTLLRTSKNQQ